MATLEDRILGEKTQYYCSSSEDEGDNDDDDGKRSSKTVAPAAPAPLPEPNEWEGTATNTGPKGVLHDWQRFKQLEAEARTEQERERLALAKKLSMTCMTSREDEERRKREQAEADALDELLDDDILLEYRKRRMREMLERVARLPTFGRVLHIESRDDFLRAVDEEHKSVTVVVHLYEESVPACRAMNGCLVSLAHDHPSVKFCKMLGSMAGLSRKFKTTGVPALLAYKAGQVVGNFVRLQDVFGDDFFAADIEGYLIEHGLLVDKSFVPAIVADDNQDSDVSLD